jgi:hypothetical protein
MVQETTMSIEHDPKQEIEEDDDDLEEVEIDDPEEAEAELAATNDEDDEDDDASLDQLLSQRAASRRGSDESEDDDDIMALASEKEPRGTVEVAPAQVIPIKDRQEFVCQRCYLVKARSQLADAERTLCRDCV